MGISERDIYFLDFFENLGVQNLTFVQMSEGIKIILLFYEKISQLISERGIP